MSRKKRFRLCPEGFLRFLYLSESRHPHSVHATEVQHANALLRAQTGSSMQASLQQCIECFTYTTGFFVNHPLNDVTFFVSASRSFASDSENVRQ